MYNGIEINEAGLLTNNIIFTFLLLLAIIAGIVAWFIFCDKESLKNQERIRLLKVKATTDPVAEKRLKKMERKNNRKRKNTLFDKALTASLILILILMLLFVAVLPGWTDYIKKDYVIYGGVSELEFEVQRDIRNSNILLDDGTVITGTLGLDEGKYSGTIVYSKRTKIMVGIEK